MDRPSSLNFCLAWCLWRRTLLIFLHIETIFPISFSPLIFSCAYVLGLFLCFFVFTLHSLPMQFHAFLDFYSWSTFSSVQFRCSVVSDSLQPHELQHTRPPCPSPTPGVHSNSCALSPWCHPTISSSVVPFSNLQSFPTSESFQMSQFSSGGQSIRVSASASVLPMNIQDWFPLGWTGWIAAVQKHQLFSAQLSFSLTLTSIHDYWNKYSFD